MASVLVKAARAHDSTGTQAAALAEGNCSSLGMQPPTRPSCPKVTDAMESRTILPRSARAPEVAGETLNLAHRQSASTHSPPCAHPPTGLPGGRGDLIQSSCWGPERLLPVPPSSQLP